jgi:glycosyltransferase involved in cell wall biosynthesis
VAGVQPSVRHVVGRAGHYSEIWLDAQVCGVDRYASSLLSLRAPRQPYRWRSNATVLSREVRAIRSVDRLPQPPEVRRAGVPDAARFLLDRAKSSQLDHPSVYHAHFGYLAYVWSGVASRADVPLVTSFYGIDAAAYCYRAGRWKARYRRVFALSGAVLVEGPHMAARIAGLGCPPEKIRIVRLPFAPPGAALDGEPTETDFAACFGGRLVAKKGLDVAIRAFSQAFAGGTEKMLLVGAGPEEERLRRLAVQVGLADRVVFHPPVPIDEFATLVRRAHVALFPSVTAPNGDGEGGAPLAIPLVQFLGVPAIVSDHDDLPWAAAPGTPVVPSGNIEALAIALSDVYGASCDADRALVQHLEAAREFVLDAYDYERLIRERELAYDAARCGVADGRGGRQGP